jgi:hypothetical protein
VGNYTITAGGAANPNYQINYVSGTLCSRRLWLICG